MKTLELAIYGKCNLSCPNCTSSMSWNKNIPNITYKEILDNATFFRNAKFQRLKISGGGEPTLHKDFSLICLNLKRLYNFNVLELATNGSGLLNYLEEIKIFDKIELTNYPSLNDEIFNKVKQLNLNNLHAIKKELGSGLYNIKLEPNRNKTNIFNKCRLSNIKQVIKNRIYPCSQVYWEILRKKPGLNPEVYGVIIDNSWERNLSAIKYEDICRSCWVNV